MATLTSKTIIRKTRKGGILKIVREHYLRDDIGCGLETCKHCENGRNSSKIKIRSESGSKLFEGNLILVPDIEVVINQIDVLEDEVISNVIILQSVIEELRRRNAGVYKRLREVISNHDKCFYVFSNEFHKDTYVERKPKESRDDRSLRCLQTAVEWFTQHTEDDRVKFVHLTNGTADSRNSHVYAVSIHEYVASLPHCEMLVEKLSTPQESAENVTEGPRYPEHLSLAEIHRGIKCGRYLQGSFMASRENYLEANVSVNDSDDMIFIQGHRNLNRAMQGDVVAIAMLEEEQWTHPSSLVIEADVSEGEGSDSDGGDIEKEVTKSKVSKLHRQPSGRVVGIIKRKWRQYCGILQPAAIKNSSRQIFMPAERRIPKIRVETRQAEKLTGKRIVVAVDSWPRHSRYPLGHFVRMLGELGDKETEDLLLDHDVPHTEGWY